MKPFFSVVMPIYNKGQHVYRSVNSALNQTFVSFELLLINDASTDNSLEEIKTFTDHRIRILHRDKPGPGGYAARNFGIQQAQADWIAFLDADDEWMTNHLENYINLINKFPKSNFLCSGFKIIDEDGTERIPEYYHKNAHKGSHEISFEEYLKLSSKYITKPTNTNVVCIKNNESAINLFPDGKADRGGDQLAWVYYMAKEKKMAWSAHIGAIYYRDSVNMVTMTKSSNPDILKYEYNLIMPLASKNEQKYLIKYLNRRASNWYFRQLLKNEKNNFRLLEYLHSNGDFIYYIKMKLFYFCPVFVLKLLKKPYNLLRRSFPKAGLYLKSWLMTP